MDRKAEIRSIIARVNIVCALLSTACRRTLLSAALPTGAFLRSVASVVMARCSDFDTSAAATISQLDRTLLSMKADVRTTNVPRRRMLRRVSSLVDMVQDETFVASKTDITAVLCKFSSGDLGPVEVRGIGCTTLCPQT